MTKKSPTRHDIDVTFNDFPLLSVTFDVHTQLSS